MIKAFDYFSEHNQKAPNDVNLNKGSVSIDICLKRYTKLDRKAIEVWTNKQSGMFAYIHLLSEHGKILETSGKLYLEGIQKGINRHTDINTVKSYFDNTYLVPKKNEDGSYNSVSVRVIGKGGGRPKIPFQPGLAVGSIVRMDELKDMEEYAEKTAQEQFFEQQIENVEKQITRLDDKINARTKILTERNKKTGEALKTDNDSLIKLYTKQKEEQNKSIKKISEKLGEEITVPIFAGFHQAMESPIDLKNSTLTTQLRGFDSVSYTSQYVTMDESTTTMHDKMMRSSSANSASASVGVGFGPWKVEVSASHAWAESAANRVRDISSNSSAQGILVINATMTSRHVRCFSEVKYDVQKLQTIYDIMKNENISDEDKEFFGISMIGKEKKQQPAIIMLTEAVLGGSFTAFVTFLNTSEGKGHNEKELKTSESESATQVGGGGSILGINLTAGGGGSHAQSKGEQTEEDLINNVKNTRINIEFVAQGAMPAFARDNVASEVLKHLKLDPSNNAELSMQEEKEIEEGEKDDHAKKIAVAKREARLAKSGSTYLNTIRGITSEKKEEKIHTLNSVMSAYENFSEKLQDKECGIPTGFNYRILTKDQIGKILEEEENRKIAEETKRSEQNKKKTELTDAAKKKEDPDGKDPIGSTPKGAGDNNPDPQIQPVTVKPPKNPKTGNRTIVDDKKVISL